jgi:hypothetical protein
MEQNNSCKKVNKDIDDMITKRTVLSEIPVESEGKESYRSAW